MKLITRPGTQYPYETIDETIKSFATLLSNAQEIMEPNSVDYVEVNPIQFRNLLQKIAMNNRNNSGVLEYVRQCSETGELNFIGIPVKLVGEKQQIINDKRTVIIWTQK